MSDNASDEQQRRDYWREQLEEAVDFMEVMLAFPVDECCEPMARLPDIARKAGVEVTFSDQPHPGDRPRMFYLRAGLADDFVGVARAMNERDWVLHVEDAYRPTHVQRGLAMKASVFDAVLEGVVWELGGQVPTTELMARRSAALIAHCPKVGTHMSGSAIDISVFRRDDGREIDRGGAYLDMSYRTPMASPFVSPEAQANRREITSTFEQFGFVAYPYEFWHYSKGDAYEDYLHGQPGPARYGAVDFDPETNKVRAIADPTARLNSLEEIAAMIRRALEKNSSAGPGGG